MNPLDLLYSKHASGNNNNGNRFYQEEPLRSSERTFLFAMSLISIVVPMPISRFYAKHQPDAIWP